MPDEDTQLPEEDSRLLPARKNTRHDSIFYFAVSHPSSLEGETACRETWAKDLEVTWYSSEKTYPDTVVVSAEPNTYANIFARVLKVWAHVYAEHRGYDWYVRLWPDNYLYSDRLVQLLDSYDPEMPQLIGRSGLLKQPNNTFDFIGGGAGWALSRAALETWVKQDGKSLDGCKPHANLTSRYHYSEDVIISTCLLKANIHFIHRGDVFLSHPPDHKDNARITPEQFKTVVTAHYMTPLQIRQAWLNYSVSKSTETNPAAAAAMRPGASPALLDDTIFRRFAVISIAASSQPDEYNFLVPFAVAAWKRIGWSTVIIVVGTQHEIDFFVSSFEDVVKVIDRNSSFVFVESSQAQKVTVSQIARLFATTATWIAPEDVILTTDVDLLPIRRDTYEMIVLSKTMTILNADCCGGFEHGGTQILMQPMSNIIGTKRDWLLMMNISERPQLSVAYIDDWLLSQGMDRIPRTQSVKGENKQWYLDQRVLSIRLALTHVNITKVTRNTADDRMDRLFPDTWPSKLGVQEMKKKLDMHAWLPAFTGQGWAEMSYFMTLMFSEEDTATLTYFKERYIHAA